MSRAAAAVVFYVALAVMLGGFFAAPWTAGAPAAVVVGSLGLLGTLAATAARIAAEDGTRAPRRWFR
jgi:hypothetical protein